MDHRSFTLDEEAGVRAAYGAYGAELFGFACRTLGDHGLAEEAVQETFLRAWRAADRFDPSIAPLRTWLYSIMRNVVIDLSRARAVRPGVAGETATVEDARARPYAEVAAELGVPEGTVKSRVYYALRALRLALEEMGWEG